VVSRLVTAGLVLPCVLSAGVVSANDQMPDAIYGPAVARPFLLAEFLKAGSEVFDLGEDLLRALQQFLLEAEEIFVVELPSTAFANGGGSPHAAAPPPLRRSRCGP
jgi:hypothetical protein